MGMGGVFNTVNLHVYHYAGDNPVKYMDPTGMLDEATHELRKNSILVVDMPEKTDLICYL